MPVMRSRTAVRRTLTMCACLAWMGAVCIEGAPQTGVRLKPDTTTETVRLKPDTGGSHA